MKPDNRDSSNAAINDPNNDGDTSPESAALARGAAASAKHGVRAAASGSVGRLPVTAPTTVAKLPPIRSTIPKPSLPRPLPRGRAPVKPASAVRAKVSPRIKSAPHRANQSIARASDRVSTGLDVWNAATTDQASNNDAHKGWRSRLPSFTQIAAFGRTFVTNTAMGMAVFATYEGLIDHFADQSTSSDIDDKVITANTENVPLSLHFFAGALGGVSHSIVSLVLETKLSILNQGTAAAAAVATSNHTRIVSIAPPKQFTPTLPFLTMHYPTLRYSIATIAHHSLAHSVLFGSYQSTKWLLADYYTTINSRLEDSTAMVLDSSQESKDDTINKEAIIYASVIAFAGGIAGQAQYLISHFTEQWFGLSNAAIDDINETRIDNRRVGMKQQFAMPAWRPALMAFPPSAIGFLAYQYGRIMV